MDPFFDRWSAAEAVHHASLSRDDPIAPVDETSGPRVVANVGIECINCSVCYAACDTVARNDEARQSESGLRMLTLRWARPIAAVGDFTLKR